MMELKERVTNIDIRVNDFDYKLNDHREQVRRKMEPMEGYD